MSITRAIFKSINGNVALLCNKCNEVIKFSDEFDITEKYASQGVTSLEAQYCDKHTEVSVNKEDIMKGIKEQLREGLMRKNVLDVAITRPTQELVIMRGIPGSGKSTKAKSLVGEGVIHSTDTLIEATGDYAGYFKRMVESKDWSQHGRMHNSNFKNAQTSMLNGVSPVVVDNTSIKASEPKKYVEAALRMGLDEANITIVDVADGGVSVEVLAERNTHNVPLDTIKRMSASHKGVGPLTVKKILEAKGGMKSERKVLYSAVVLDDKSKAALLQQFASMLPEGWKTIGHHMTIVFGRGIEDKDELGEEVELTVEALGVSDKALAVRVGGYPTTNKIPHITVAVNAAGGGKPFDSNKITDWASTDLGHQMKLYGVVTDITV